ncbi:methyltransferase domain-containing protein [Niveibacterium terrae]|uniref:class I SAM-dependent methyltransferase n=1 Tax=Niveibacterium terrae TaxID=3373598 RepID=UPI003A8EFAB4
MSLPRRISFADPERLSLIFDAENRAEWQNTGYILEHLALTAGMRVADVGAGTGYFTELFAREIIEGVIHALDPEPNMQAHMRERFARVRVGACLPANPCLPEDLDLVFLANVYRFIEDRSGFLTRLAEQVGLQTRIVFVDFKGESSWVGPQQAEAEVRQAGFAVRQLDLVGCPDHYIMSFGKP